jgi:hypothetical protein
MGLGSCAPTIRAGQSIIFGVVSPFGAIAAAVANVPHQLPDGHVSSSGL